MFYYTNSVPNSTKEYVGILVGPEGICYADKDNVALHKFVPEELKRYVDGLYEIPPASITQDEPVLVDTSSTVSTTEQALKRTNSLFGRITGE